MRNITTHMNFDLAIAKKQSDENPVFYLQYAHARICSILKMVEKERLSASEENFDLLITPEEQQLLKKLHQFLIARQHSKLTQVNLGVIE